mmetsp:Transcript_23232/g.35018  ORF Transcript_23232/g.35018 Transcript_23232/m.35018 type:complete len:330 (+) Transcript_23232:95-1084(+)
MVSLHHLPLGTQQVTRNASGEIYLCTWFPAQTEAGSWESLGIFIGRRCSPSRYSRALPNTMVLQELPLQLVHLWRANDQGVQRSTKVGFHHLATRSKQNSLIVTAKSGDPDDLCRICRDAFASVLFDFPQLLQGLCDGHEPRWLVDFPSTHEVLDGLLLGLDVQQAKGVKAGLVVGQDLVIETSRLPIVHPERNGDGLAKSIELKTAGGDGIHDRGIVNDFNLDSHLSGSEPQIAMRCCAESIPDHEERDDIVLGSLQHFLATTLDQLAVCLDDVLNTVSGCQLLLAEPRQNRGVGLEVDVLAFLQSFLALQSDVVGITQSQADHPQHD